MEGERQQLGLERHAQLAIGVAHTAQRIIEHLCRGPEVAERRPRAAEGERDLRADARIARLGHRLAQVAVEAVSLAVGRLGHAELVKDGAALLFARWLRERAPQVMRSRPGVAPRRRATGGRPQYRHAREVGGRRQREQVPRDPLALRAPGREDLRGLNVKRLTLERRDLLVHGAAHHRMNEVERALGRQHVDADQRVGCPVGHRDVRFGDRGHLVERAARAEDRGRAGDRGCLGWQPAQPPADSAADALRSELQHLVRLVRGALDAVIGEFAEELAEEERIAASGSITRCAERIDSLGQPLADHGPRCAGGERGRPQNMDIRRDHQRIEQLLVGPGLRRPRGHDEQRLHVLDALGEEHQPPQRSLVGPVDVIGEQQQRLTRREVHHEPMQSLQRREDTLLSARLASHRGKYSRGGLRPARQQLGVVGDLALKKLAGQPKRERPVQRGAPGAQNAKPFSLAHLLRGAEKLSLSEAGLGLDEKQATLTAAYAGDLRRYQLQLAFTL